MLKGEGRGGGGGERGGGGEGVNKKSLLDPQEAKANLRSIQCRYMYSVPVLPLELW